MRIPTEVVEEVRRHADIVAVIGEFVSLKKAGKDYRGLSPFKDENTPSFFVIPDKDFFHDFSSGESGDVFKFLTKHQGMSFADAVRYVGERCGVKVRTVSASQQREDPWGPYREANAWANTHFQACLWERDEGQEAREYLEERGISRELAERVGLGYAPDSWKGLYRASSVHDIEESVLVSVGLCKKSEKGGHLYDAFRQRIMFPILSFTGSVLGFGGRLLGPVGKGAPKYINSPEGPIFDKGKVLYGLSWARNDIRRQGYALLVEGFMDVVSLLGAGIENVVAPLGTALTPPQAELIKRYTDQVRIAFDSDPAGLRATFRTADRLLSRGVRAAVVTLPEGEDPDSLVRSEGGDSFRRLAKQAVDVLDRKLAMLEERDHFSSIERTRRALDRLLPTLRAVQDATLRDIYLDRVSQRTGVQIDTLEEEVRAAAPSVHGISAGRRGRPRSHPLPPALALGPERLLLLLMLKHRDWIERVGERLGPSDLEDGVYRAIFEALIAYPDLTVLPEGAAAETLRRFERLMADPETLASPARVYSDTVAQLESRRRGRQQDALRIQMLETDDDDERLRLLAEIQRVGLRAADPGRSARAVLDIGRMQTGGAAKK